MKNRKILIIAVALGMGVLITSLYLLVYKTNKLNYGTYEYLSEYATEENIEDQYFVINTSINNFYLNSENNNLEIDITVFNAEKEIETDTNLDIPFEKQNLTVEEIYQISESPFGTLTIYPKDNKHIFGEITSPTNKELVLALYNTSIQDDETKEIHVHDYLQSLTEEMIIDQKISSGLLDPKYLEDLRIEDSVLPCLVSEELDLKYLPSVDQTEQESIDTDILKNYSPGTEDPYINKILIQTLDLTKCHNTQEIIEDNLSFAIQTMSTNQYNQTTLELLNKALEKSTTRLLTEEEQQEISNLADKETITEIPSTSYLISECIFSECNSNSIVKPLLKRYKKEKGYQYIYFPEEEKNKEQIIIYLYSILKNEK